MLITLNENIGSRVCSWCRLSNQSPEAFVISALEQYLEDLEDYSDAVHLCAEVDAGRMKTYSLAEVTEHLNALEN